MNEVGPNCPCHHSDALIRIRLLHGVVMYDNFQTMENTVDHLQEEDSHHQDIFDPIPL